MSKFRGIRRHEPAPVLARQETANTETASRGRGRPPGNAGGKRNDPDYVQLTAYIRKATHLDTKIALLKEGRGRELSELVEDLLNEWLKSNR